MSQNNLSRLVVFVAFVVVSVSFRAVHAEQSLSEQRLVYAVGVGDISAVRKLLAEGVDPNTRTVEGGPQVIFLAVMLNRPDIIELLAQNGADLDVKFDFEKRKHATPLSDAICAFGRFESALRLIKLGASITDNQCAFLSNAIFWSFRYEIAAEKRAFSKRVALALLARGADVKGYDNTASSPLFAAIRARSPEFVKMILDAGADPNLSLQQGKGGSMVTPLGEAVRLSGVGKEAKNRILHTLLSYGADPNGISLGKRILDLAVLKEDWVFELLLHSGADPNLGNTIEDAMLVGGIKWIFPLLFKYGANINRCHSGDLTRPLIRAVEYGNIGFVKLFLKNGADVCLRDGDGRTVFDVAAATGDADLLGMLPPCTRPDTPDFRCH